MSRVCFTLNKTFVTSLLGKLCRGGNQMHHFSLSQSKSQVLSPNGIRLDGWKSQFPALQNMAISLLKIEPKSQREPHWHPNAHELGYCLAGKGVMTVYSPGSAHDTFTLEPGVLAFVPEGSIHYIENVGSEPLELLLCFNDENPEELSLSSSIGCMSDRVLERTLNVPDHFFDKIKKSEDPLFMTNKQTVHPTDYRLQTNRLKLNLMEVEPQLHNGGGWVKFGSGGLFPILDGLAMYFLKLEYDGIREPHWHPNAHELNYLIKGTVRITLLSPPNKVETFDMVPGDISFLPKGYFHHIENTSKEPAELAIFFSNHFPSDIGLSACMGAFDNSVLTSLFGLPQTYFDNMTKFQKNRLLVR